MWIRIKITIIAIAVLTGCIDDSKERKPNIVFLLVDDLGYKDLSCYGSTFYETPYIDRLAREGVLFTESYSASAVCSPTRASILTGKYPTRVNITDWIPGYDPKNRPLIGAKDLDALPLEEITIAEVLKEEGYVNGFFGKWHLGGNGFFPEDQGFDVNVGGHAAGQPASYFYPYKNDRKFWDVPGLDEGEEGEYLTDRLTDEALDFIEDNKQSPFFLYFCYYNVHTPIQGKDSLVNIYKDKLGDANVPIKDTTEHDAFTKIKQDNPTYAAMIHSVDESVGRLMAYLKANGLDENTIVIFTSDNGGLTTLGSPGRAPTSVRPLRAGKGWFYEGGIKIPTIIKYPGVTTANSVIGHPVISMDFFPTVSEIVTGHPCELPLDGVSLLPFLRNEELKSRKLFWHFPHYHGSKNRPVSVVRDGDYKLIHWHENDRYELYNLRNDLEESIDIALSNQAIVDSLSWSLKTWKRETKANMPIANTE